MLNKVIEKFKLVKIGYNRFTESTAWSLWINYRTLKAVTNAGSTFERSTKETQWKRLGFKNFWKAWIFPTTQKPKKVIKVLNLDQRLSISTENFFWCVLNDATQNVSQQMVKFKDWSSIEKSVQSKLLKWPCKFWYCCARKQDIFISLNCICKRKNFKVELGRYDIVVRGKCLKTYYISFFDNIFNNLLPIAKYFKVFCRVWIAGIKRKSMPEITFHEIKNDVITSFCFP